MKFTFPPESKPLDGYTIKRAIQRGGFGEVYYALSDGGKEVALKLLQQNLDIELRGVSQCLNLKHPNLLTIFDIRTDDDGDHWIVMEYVSGKNLDEVIDACGGPMPVEEVQSWLDGIAAGLNFLHDRGIVHRDLKPANIYREHGTVKIGDVGLAKFISESRRSAQTQSVGTVYYMAPEVAHGCYGREVDIYSLAVIVYEMLTGRVPFDGESTGEILMKHLSEKPDLSSLPERLRPVLARALEKDPMHRTPTARELADDFRKAAAGVELAQDIPEDSFAGHTAANSAADDRNRSADDRAANWDKLDASTARKEARKAARYARKEMRKSVRHSRKIERKAALHARKMQKKAYKHAMEAARYASAEIERATEKFQGRGDRVHVDRRNKKVVVTPAKKEHPKQDWWEMHGHWLKIAAVVAIVLAIFAPGTFFGLMRVVVTLAIYGAVGYGIYLLVTHLSKSQQRPKPHRYRSAVASRAPESVNRAADTPQAAQPVYEPDDAQSAAFAPAQPAYRTKTRKRRTFILSPNTPREISLRRRMIELTGSMTFAIVCTAIITAALAFLGVLPDAASIGMFNITALLASWAVLVPSKLSEGTDLDSGMRRLMQLGVGVLVGMGAFWLDQTLMADLWNESWVVGSRPDAAFEHVGSHALLEQSQPTMAAYILFFGALFGVRRWWWHVDSFRATRFRIRTALCTGAIGFLLPWIWAFPLTWGALWALTISSVAQLSAVWTPPKYRERLVQAAREQTDFA